MTPVTSSLPLAAGGQILENGGLAPSLKILLVLTLLALLPAIILTMTSFVRTVVVLSFVRQGVGSHADPAQPGRSSGSRCF